MDELNNTQHVACPYNEIYLLITENEVLIHATTWMNSKNSKCYDRGEKPVIKYQAFVILFI